MKIALKLERMGLLEPTTHLLEQKQKLKKGISEMNELDQEMIEEEIKQKFRRSLQRPIKKCSKDLILEKETLEEELKQERRIF